MLVIGKILATLVTTTLFVVIDLPLAIITRENI